MGHFETTAGCGRRGDLHLTTDLIASALRESPPLSVTMAEKVAELRAWAKNRCVPAD